MTWLIGHLLAVGIGVSLGLLGGGGSVLALPVLVYVMGVEPKSAIPMTLVIVGTVSLLGTIPHARHGNLSRKAAAIFGSATMVGAYGGARLANLPWVTSAFQMLLFGGLMLIAAGLMIYKSLQRSAPRGGLVPDHSSGSSPHKPVCKYCWLWLMLEGIAVGVLTGLVGVGGGFAIVPALVLLGKIPMRQAIGTSLLIIACNAVAGLLGYLGNVSLDWNLTISFTLLASSGTLLGVYLTQFIPVQQLQKGFGYFLLVVATFVLFQNHGSLHSRNQPLFPVRTPSNHWHLANR